MSVKVIIHEIPADGEQVTVEYQLEPRDYERLKTRSVKRVDGLTELVPGEPLLDIMAPYFKLVDDRRWEYNKRVVAANYYQKKLAKVSPEGMMLVTEIWEILHGRRSGPAMEQVLEQDRLEREAAIAKLQKDEIAPANGAVNEPHENENTGTIEDAPL